MDKENDLDDITEIKKKKSEKDKDVQLFGLWDYYGVNKRGEAEEIEDTLSLLNEDSDAYEKDRKKKKNEQSKIKY